MADDNEAFRQVYDALVAEHACTEAHHLAICRALATLLAEDHPDDPLGNARTANNLAALLPPKQPRGTVDKIIVEYVTPSKPDQVESVSRTNARLQDEVQRLKAELWQLRGGGTVSAEARDPLLPPVLPVTPDSAAAAPADNVVQLQPKQKLAQDMTDEEKRQHMKELRAAAGDTNQPLRRSHDGLGPGASYSEALPPGIGHRKFDHPGW